jgi:hypothetical protein
MLQANDVTPVLWIFIGPEVSLGELCETKACHILCILSGYVNLNRRPSIFFIMEQYSRKMLSDNKLRFTYNEEFYYYAHFW